MIEEIIKSGATNVTLSVSPMELEEFALSIVEKYKQMDDARAKEDVRLSQKEVSEMLGVSLNSLWRWEQKKYLVPAGRVGKKPYYLKSQIINLGKEVI